KSSALKCALLDTIPSPETYLCMDLFYQKPGSEHKTPVHSRDLEKPMSGHDIIVIGASAGGVEALVKLVHELPAGLPAAVFVVLHIPARSPSLLPAILSRYGPLPAVHPSDDTKIEH